jgi:tetratricopeptide (TPR) repeat protein
MRTKLRLNLRALPDTDGWGEYVDHMETLRRFGEEDRAKRSGFYVSVLTVAAALFLMVAVGLYASRAAADLRTQVTAAREQRAEAAYERGVFFNRRRRYEDAVKQLRAAIEVTPRAEYHNELGEAYLGLRSRGQAIAQFDKALEVDPGNVQALSKKGWAYAADQDFTRSRQLFEEAAKHSRTTRDQILVLGDRGWASIQESGTKDRVKERAEKERLLKSAIRDLQGALRLLENSRQAADHKQFERDVFADDIHNTLAWAYNELGRFYEKGSVESRRSFEAAIRESQEAIGLNKDFSWAYHNLGDAFWGLGDMKSAIGAYSRSLEADPVNAWSFWNRGKAYAQMAREAHEPTEAKRLEDQAHLDLEEARRLGIHIQE